MTLSMYWFRGVKLKWVNIRRSFVFVACDSFSHLNCPCAKIRNIIEWDALIRFTDLARLSPMRANSTGENILVFTLCGQQAIFLNFRCGWIRIWLWPDLVDASPQKALLLALVHDQTTTVCVAQGFLSLWFSEGGRCCSALENAACSSVCSRCLTSCALLPWSNDVQCKMWT